MMRVISMAILLFFHRILIDIIICLALVVVLDFFFFFHKLNYNNDFSLISNFVQAQFNK